MQILKRIFGQAKASRQDAASPREAFDQARAQAAQTNSCQVVLVRPDLSFLVLACPAADSMPQNVIDQMETIVPSSVRRNIAVITSTGFAARSSRAEVGSPGWTAAGEAIPFFGILNGLAYIGHSVWVFDRTSQMEAACRNADILIIDSAVADDVPAASLDAARKVMRSPSILIHDRLTYQLRPVAPKVKSGVDWADLFEKARSYTKRDDRFQMVLVQPDHSLLCLPCIPRKAMTSDLLAQAHRVVPEGMPRNIAVIAATRLVDDPVDSSVPPAVARFRAASRTIPFYGTVLNLASAGNPVWIFEGPDEAVTFGCCQADLLLIDSIFADKLTTRTLDEAAKVMRSENIAVYERESKQILLLRHVGASKDKLEFRN